MRRAALRFALAAAAACLPAPALAAETVDLADAEKRGWLREDWYGVSCGDVRVGWMRRTLARTKHGDRDAVVREVEVRLDVVGDGNDVISVTRTVFAAEPPQLLLAASLVRWDQGRVVAREIERNGARFDVVTERQDERVTGAVPSVTIVLADELGFERAAAAPGTPVTVTSIDLSTLASGTRTFTASAVPAAEGAAPDGFDVSVVVGRVREGVRTDAAGGVTSGALGPRFRYSRTTRDDATSPTWRGSLEKLSRVALVSGDAPAKLGDVAAIGRFSVAWDDGRDRVFAASGRQRVRRDGNALVVEVVRDAAGEEVTDAARADALSDAPGLDLGAPVLGEAASKILAGTADRGPQVSRLLEFTSTRMKKEIVLGTPRVTEILREMRGDCTEHARLFVALCRKAGLPARTVEGLCWTGDATGTFGWHMWAEVALAGKWVAVDPTTGAIPAPATHLAVDGSPEARTLLWGQKLRLLPDAPR